MNGLDSFLPRQPQAEESALTFEVDVKIKKERALAFGRLPAKRGDSGYEANSSAQVILSLTISLSTLLDPTEGKRWPRLRKRSASYTATPTEMQQRFQWTLATMQNAR